MALLLGRPLSFQTLSDQVARICVPESEIHDILAFCHSYAYGGNFRSRRTAAKVLQDGFFWPTLFRNAHRFCLACEHCQRARALSHCGMMLLSPILIIDIFDVWAIDFISLFLSPFGFVYILVVIDYVSKWVEA